MDTPVDETPSQTLIAREIGELYAIATSGAERGKRVAKIRKPIAYVLRLIAGGASLLVAIGAWPFAHQAFGIAAFVAIFADALTSNHRRLLAEVEAGYAYQFLKDRIHREHNRKLDSLIKKLQRVRSADEPTADVEAKIEDLEQETAKRLAEGIQEIRYRLAEADLRALQALSLDHERAARSTGASSE